jgi:hypothetical protein
MIPTEKKAREIYERFHEIKNLNNYEAKQCVLICVDEIIEECSNWTGGTNDGWDRKRFDYWQEVKNHIEKL